MHHLQQLSLIHTHRRYKKKYKQPEGPLASPTTKDNIPLHDKIEKAMPTEIKSC